VSRTPGFIELASVRHIPTPDDLLILCHHGVSSRWPTEFAISPETLEKQVRFLLGHGYEPLTLAAALAPGAPAKALVVSFDDAYRSVLSEGFPVLERLGVPATVFVPTAFPAPGKPMAWAGMERWLGTRFEAELEPMSWDELRGLQEVGWEVGSHSRGHRDLVLLDEAELAGELRESREDCERELGRPCLSLAYPFSSYDERVKRVASESGYEAAVILDSELPVPPRSVSFAAAGTDHLELLRAGIYRHDSWPRFRFKVSARARRIRASGALHRAMRMASGRVSS
jgi:peptidoglycan/xylan/chitin deacetylase (PgdA/CDA1 family)